MKKHDLFVFCATLTSLAVFGLVMKSDLANAQQASEEQTAEAVEEIVAVEAPIERGTEMITLTRQVTYRDLDLSKHADVTELERRIDTIARESCEKLEELYPLPRNPSKVANIKRCTRKAIETSAEEVQAAIAAAQ